jgi:hypothetical protein
LFFFFFSFSYLSACYICYLISPPSSQGQGCLHHYLFINPYILIGLLSTLMVVDNLRVLIIIILIFLYSSVLDLQFEGAYYYYTNISLFKCVGSTIWGCFIYTLKKGCLLQYAPPCRKEQEFKEINCMNLNVLER